MKKAMGGQVEGPESTHVALPNKVTTPAPVAFA